MATAALDSFTEFYQVLALVFNFKEFLFYQVFFQLIHRFRQEWQQDYEHLAFIGKDEVKSVETRTCKGKTSWTRIMKQRDLAFVNDLFSFLS